LVLFIHDRCSTALSTLSLHDALPIYDRNTAEPKAMLLIGMLVASAFVMILNETILSVALRDLSTELHVATTTAQWLTSGFLLTIDRKSTRLNSSHVKISYAVFCLKEK